MFNFQGQTDLTIKNLDGKQWKNSDLNLALGTGGEPKYTANQMKAKKRVQLEDELRGLMLELQPKKGKKTKAADSAPRGAKLGISKNPACAASKKCNAIKALIANKKTVDDLQAMYDADPVLQAYWKPEQFQTDIVNATQGKRPKTAKLVQLTMDL